MERTPSAPSPAGSLDATVEFQLDATEGGHASGLATDHVAAASRIVGGSIRSRRMSDISFSGPLPLDGILLVGGHGYHAAKRMLDIVLSALLLLLATPLLLLVAVSIKL